MSVIAEKQPCLVIPRHYVATPEGKGPQPIPAKHFLTNSFELHHLELVITETGESKFMERKDVEHDENWVQPVVPMVLTHNDHVLYLKKKPYEDKGDGQFVENRIVAPDGQRPDILFASGHIEERDFRGGRNRSYDWGLRELHEELVIPKTAVLTPYSWGVVNDRTTAVGRVHIGLVQKVEVSDQNIVVNEKEKELEDAIWIEIASLHKYANRFDSWSQMIAVELQKQHALKRDMERLAANARATESYFLHDSERI